MKRRATFIHYYYAGVALAAWVFCVWVASHF